MRGPREALATLSVTTLIVACTTYGAEPETDIATRDGGDGAVRGEADAAPSLDATATDGSSDDATGADSGSPCALEPNGSSCDAASACCSGKCGENRTCVAMCKALGDTCDPLTTTACCLGMWCSSTCAPCIMSGFPAAQPGGFPVAHSCCSRALKTGTTTCE